MIRLSIWVSRALPSMLFLLLSACDGGGDGGSSTPTENPPSLEVSGSSVSFVAEQGSEPAAQTFTIRNSGQGTLNWRASESLPWLSLSASNGSLSAGVSTSVNVSASTVGLGSGTYTGTVEISADGVTGSPQRVTITLTVTPAPSLGVSPVSLSFAAQQGSAPPAQTLVISNMGGGTLQWTASEPIPWLLGSPASGSLGAGQSTSMAVSVNTAGLAPGSYTGTITVTAPGATSSPRTVEVTLTVTPVPALGVSPASLSFTAEQGSNPAGQTLTISNTGTGTLAWTATEPIPWLVGSPGSGSLGAGQSAPMAVSVNTAGLAPGSYSGTITVTAPGATSSPRTVAISLTVTPPASVPALGVSPASMSFSAEQGSNPTGQTLTISNTGTGTLAWTATEPIPWLVGNPGSGSLGTGQSASMAVSVNTAGLAPGSYSGTIAVTAPGATSSPRTITVSLTVTPPAPTPTLGVSPASLSFTAEQGSNPAEQTLTISNTGTGTLAWTATEPIPWLVGSPGSGSLGAGQSAPMAVSVNTAGLAPGSYSGTITVTSPGATNSPRAIAVSLTVTPPAPVPALGVSPTSLSFTAEQGSNPASQALTISNTGTGTLTWTANEPIPWLVGSPGSGSLGAGQSASMAVSVNTAGLAPGNYTGTITVTAPGATGSPRTTAVSLTVTPPAPVPALGVSPTSLSFTAEQGSNPAGQALTISNTGTGTLAWTANEPIPWLVGSPGSGSLGAGQSAPITVSVNTAGLAPGSYSGTIIITAPGTTGSPRTADVSLTVTFPNLLPAPSLLSPGNGATGVAANPTFTWSPVSGADRYWVMVATDPSVFPTDPNAESCPGCVISGNVAGTSYTPPAGFLYPGKTTTLNANARYYWKVQAWNSSPKRQGSYPAAHTFIVAPARPMLRIDGTASSTRAIGETFVSTGSGFTPNGAVTRYLRDPNGNQVVLTPTLTANGSGNISWSFTPECTTPLGTSRLWARDDATGQVSDTVTQIVTASSTCGSTLLPAPSLSSPANQATGVSVNPTFRWSAVSGADRYWVMVATDPSVFPTDPNAESCPGCVISGNVNSTSYTPPGGFLYPGKTTTLSPNTRYYWKVQAWNSSPKRQGSYPPAFSFTTAGPVGPPPLTCPPGWSQNTGNGVVLCRQNRTLSGGTEMQYVVQVNLRQGGRILSLYDTISPFTSANQSPRFSMLTVQNWWNNYGPHGDWFCLLNGAPFMNYQILDPRRPGRTSTELSFPFRDNGNFVTVGAEGLPKTKSALLLYPDRASIVSYPLSWGAPLSVINNALPAPVAVVALDRNYPSDDTKSEGQTFVAVKDADNDGFKEIVLFYITLKASRKEVNSILTNEFKIGAPDAMQLDGGESSQLRCVVDNINIAGKDLHLFARPVPHVFLLLH
jgi:hypothetical protein